VTRRGYHCRGQPGLAHGKPAVIGRQNRPLLPGEFATPERHKNVPLKSGTTSSNPVPSSGESANFRHGLPIDPRCRLPIVCIRLNRTDKLTVPSRSNLTRRPTTSQSVRCASRGTNEPRPKSSPSIEMAGI
jgi:hypothetical protein